MIEKILGLDTHLFILLNKLRSPFFDIIFPYFSKEEFIYAFYFLFLAIWIKFTYKKRYLSLNRIFLISFVMFLGFLVTDFFCGNLWKPLFNRERPYVSLKDIFYYSKGEFTLIKDPLTNKHTLSFPSCHASNVGFASFFLSLFAPKLRLPLMVFALLVGYSRIYLGHHYPLDILGGYVWGIFNASVWLYICKRVILKFS